MNDHQSDFPEVSIGLPVYNGELFIETRAHGTRNHGTAFRMFEKYFPKCYSTTETID